MIAPSFLVKSVSSDSPGYHAYGSSYAPNATVSVDYHYQGLRMQSGGRGNLGFAAISSYDNQSDITTTTQYHQDWPYIGMPKRTVQYLGSSTETVDSQYLSIAENTVAKLSLYEGEVIMPYIQSATEKAYTINGSSTKLVSTATTASTYNGSACGIDLSTNNYGLLTKMSVTTVDEITLNNPDTQTKTTENCYAAENTTNWWLNRLTQTKVTHQLTNQTDIIRTSRFEYNETSGLLTAEIIEPEGTNDQYLKTAYQHDAYGRTIKLTQCSKDYADSCGTQTDDSASNDGSLKIYREKTTSYGPRQITQVDNPTPEYLYRNSVRIHLSHM